MKTTSAIGIAASCVLLLTSCAPHDDAGDRKTSTVLRAECYSVTEIDNRRFGGGVSPPVDLDERGRLLFQPFVWDNGTRSPLPLPAGWVLEMVTDFNERGDVVGMVRQGGGSIENRAVVWWSDGTIDLLPDVEPKLEVREITERGHVLATAGATVSTSRGLIFRDGAWVDLGRGIAMDVNEKDEVVLVADRRVILWKDGARIDLGVSGASEVKINGRSQIMVTAERAGPGTEAVFLWEAGVARQLPGLAFLADTQRSQGIAFNERGDVAGYVIVPGLSTFFTYPVLWRDGTPIVLADVNGSALGLNEAGQVTGIDHTGGELRPFVWDSGSYFELPKPFVARSGTLWSAQGQNINERGDVFWNLKPVDAISRTLLWRNDRCGNGSPEPPEPEPE